MMERQKNLKFKKPNLTRAHSKSLSQDINLNIVEGHQDRLQKLHQKHLAKTNSHIKRKFLDTQLSRCTLITPVKPITPGPFRATRLWKALIKYFTSRMPVKKHYSHLGLKTYENSFTGLEAVDFLHNHLVKNPNYGTSVTRQQAVMLLKKFFEQRVIISAVCTNHLKFGGHSSNSELKDNELPLENLVSCRRSCKTHGSGKNQNSNSKAFKESSSALYCMNKVYKMSPIKNRYGDKYSIGRQLFRHSEKLHCVASLSNQIPSPIDGNQLSDSKNEISRNENIRKIILSSRSRSRSRDNLHLKIPNQTGNNSKPQRLSPVFRSLTIKPKNIARPNNLIKNTAKECPSIKIKECSSSKILEPTNCSRTYNPNNQFDSPFYDTNMNRILEQHSWQKINLVKDLVIEQIIKNLNCDSIHHSEGLLFEHNCQDTNYNYHDLQEYDDFDDFDIDSEDIINQNIYSNKFRRMTVVFSNIKSPFKQLRFFQANSNPRNSSTDNKNLKNRLSSDEYSSVSSRNSNHLHHHSHLSESISFDDLKKDATHYHVIEPSKSSIIESMSELGLYEENISPVNIIWNLEKISPSGVVMSNSSHHLMPPTNVLSAMKILSAMSSNNNYKKPYDNYVKDVFQTIVKYYTDQFDCSNENNENQPLLTYDLYELLLAILDTIDSNVVDNRHNTRLPEHVHTAFTLSLLLLPPNNRRHLHLLLRLITKMISQPEKYEILIDSDDGNPKERASSLKNGSSILTKTQKTLLLKTKLIKIFWPCVFRTQISHGLEEVLGIRFLSILLNFYATLLAKDNIEKIKKKLFTTVNDQIRLTQIAFHHRKQLKKQELLRGVAKNLVGKVLNQTILSNNSNSKSKKIDDQSTNTDTNSSTSGVHSQETSNDSIHASMEKLHSSPEFFQAHKINVSPKISE